MLSGPRAAAALLPPRGKREGRIPPFSPQVEECVLNLGKFHNIVRLVAFCPFSSSQVALENANAVSEGELATKYCREMSLDVVLATVNPLTT